RAEQAGSAVERTSILRQLRPADAAHLHEQKAAALSLLRLPLAPEPVPEPSTGPADRSLGPSATRIHGPEPDPRRQAGENIRWAHRRLTGTGQTAPRGVS